MRFLPVCVFIALVMAFFAPGGRALADGCRDVQFDGADYVVCSFDPKRQDIRLFHEDGLSGAAFGGFDALTQALWRNREFLRFAMNAGMYHDDLSPVGLFIDGGVVKSPAVTGGGYGNFHLLPNGIFYLGDGKAGVSETGTFLASGLRPRYATQSGPMLVIDGALHPRFLPESDSLKIRNGVGVSGDGRVHFALSAGRVRFYDFARLFRDGLACPNALYLDGTISGMLIPERGRKDTLFPMGPMLGVVERVPY